MYQTQEQTAEAVFRIVRAEEIPFSETVGGPKLTKGNFLFAYEGGMQGEGILEELKVHFTPKRAEIYGLQRFTGKVGEMQGSFILKHTGRFANGVVYVKMTVVPGSGTGALKGIRGEIRLKSGQTESFPVTLHYRFA
jgi:hypothetical protein